MVRSRKKKTAQSDKSESSPEIPAFSQGALSKPASGERMKDNPSLEVFHEVEDYAIILLDPSGQILTWNKGAEKIKGYTPEEIIGKNYRLFYTSEDKEKRLSETLLDKARVNGRTNYEGWRVRKDGSRFWGSVTLTALHNEDGNIRGFLKITRDLTEKRIAEDHYSNFVEALKLKNEDLRASEERYHKMISEVTDYAIILLDKDGKILDWNKGAEKLKGYSASEVIGKSFRLFYPREEKESLLPERLLAEAVKNGSITHEGWRIKKDGTRFWGNITLTALRDSEGNIIGFSKLTRDLTQRKIAEDRVSIVMEELRQANKQLKESEERYQRMIAEVQDYAIILLNEKGDIQNWNAGAQFIKGYDASEIIGKSFRIFYTEEDRKSRLPERLLQQAVTEGKATHEGWRVRKDGSYFWGSIVITALHNPQGDIIGFSKVTRDLTERKSAEDQLKSNAAQLDLKNKILERLNEELSSFTRVASHDMKEPLRKIQTFASRIESVNLDPSRSREFLDKIKSTAAGMQDLIEDLLSYSQVSGDRGSLTFENIDLNKILEGVIVDLEVPIQEKGVVIDVKRLPNLLGVRHQLHQMFLNLLSNSIKFSRPEESPRITIRCETIKGPDIPGYSFEKGISYYHIRIRDNGIGFSHQHSDKIFEAFQRLHPRSVFSGSGIGLAIVKKVVENHNGVISAEGIPGEGATFHIYLPAGG